MRVLVWRCEMQNLNASHVAIVTPLRSVSLQPLRVWAIDLPELMSLISEVTWLESELKQEKLQNYSTGGTDEVGQQGHYE